jgi:hypothetical protein
METAVSPLTNAIRNPSAEGATASLAADVSTTVTMVADTSTGAGARSYRLAHSATGRAGALVRAAERPAAAAGQRWWARARCRLDPSLIGARKVSSSLVFRDVSGAVLSHAQAALGQVAGPTYRWLGAPYASASERREGDAVRVNRAQFPDELVARGFGPSGAGTVATLTGSGLPGGPDRFARKTWTTAATSNGNTGFRGAVSFPVTAGETITVSGYLRSSSARRKTAARAKITFIGGAGDLNNDFLTLPANQWVRTSVTRVVPAGITEATAVLDVDDGDPWLAGETLDGTGLLVESSGGIVLDYFDGSFIGASGGYTDQSTFDLIPSGVFHRWTASADASLSERYEGTSKRVNFVTDPAPAVTSAWGGDGSAGGTNITKTMVAAAAPSGLALRATWTVNTSSGFNIARIVTGVPVGVPLTATVYGRASFAGFVARLAVICFNDVGVGLGAFYPPQNSNIGSAYSRMTTSFVAPLGTTRVGLYFDWGGGSYPQAGDFVELSSALLEVGSTAGAWFSGSSANSGTGNTQQVVEFLVAGDAPAGTASADLLIYRDPQYQAAAVDVEFVDHVALEQYDRAVPPPFGDGTTAGWYWNGTANAATSSYGRGSPAVTVDPDTWSAGIRFDSLFPATQTLTVTAITPEGTYPVRSADRAYAVGGYVGTDYELPAGVDVTYRGQMFAADGSDLGFTDATVARFDIDPSLVIVSDPLEPGNAVLVEARSEFGETKVRRRRGNTYRVGNRTIGLYAPLGLLESVKLSVQTKGLADADMLERVLTAMPILVRSMPPVRLPRQLYVAIESAEVEDVDVQFGGEWTTYPLEGAQVSRSVTDIVVPVVTWQTYMDAYPTWAAFNAAYATWLDAMDNPPEV